MSDFLTDQQIKEKIAYTFHMEDEKTGFPGNPNYDWTRARRVFEFYTTPPEQDPYWKRGSLEYERFAYLFKDRCVDGSRIKE
jgi:hypothetical protein